jgi:hypothetical protein
MSTHVDRLTATNIALTFFSYQITLLTLTTAKAKQRQNKQKHTKKKSHDLPSYLFFV